MLLHIGAHKTGTTTLQAFLAANRARLRRAGTFYPDLDIIGAGTAKNHHAVAHGIAEWRDPALSRARVETFCAKVLSSSKKYACTILSSESFARHEVDGEGLDYWGRRDRFVSRVAAVLDPERVELVYTVRRQDAFATSLYGEKIKTGTYARSFEGFCAHDAQDLDFARQLDVWRRYYPRVRVLVYEDLPKGAAMPRAVLAALDVPVGKVAAVASANRSMSVELLALKLMMNRAGFEAAELNRLRRISTHPMLTELAGPAPHRLVWASHARLRRLVAQHAEGNARLLADPKLNLSPERDTLFPPIPAGAGEGEVVFDEFSDERLRQLCGAMMALDAGEHLYGQLRRVGDAMRADEGVWDERERS